MGGVFETIGQILGSKELINNREIYDLLIAIDRGYSISKFQKHRLSSVTSIVWQDITKLPYSMRLLTSLTNLDVSWSRVIDIRVLSNLTSLTNLDLSFTSISDISALSNLTSLANLDLRYTSVSDISALSNLTSLTNLDLSCTPVSDISALSNLTSLMGLEFSEAPVKDISVLSNLTSLTNLDLRWTQVSDISPLSGLKNLKTLDLGGIEINDLGVLSRLFTLRRLNIQNSTTTSIPESLFDLNLNFVDEENKIFNSDDAGIYINGLTLTDQPIEIFSQNRELIRAYYREGDQVPVNECKVIFLGDAESGKTHSIKRLLNNGEFLKDFDGGSTPGVERRILSGAGDTVFEDIAV